MGVLTTFALAIAAVTPPTCPDARAQYEALDVESAVRTAREVLDSDPLRPLECLEIQSLALLVLGRSEEAKEVLTELFQRAPERRIEDASLSPTVRDFIEQTRVQLIPLKARVTARWIVHESVRLDFALDGGLRNARSIRYEAKVDPAGGRHTARVDLEGRAATATVAVVKNVDARTVTIEGHVVDELGRDVHQFSSQILLPKRPLSSETIVEVESGTSALVWIVAAAAVVGTGVAIAIVSQRNEVGAAGLGRVEVPQ